MVGAALLGFVILVTPGDLMITYNVLRLAGAGGGHPDLSRSD
ncbi:hypothetical protein ACRAWD_04635 [Caulobacter segnis]